MDDEMTETLAELEVAYNTAKEKYEEAEKATQCASRQETNAMNELNRAQKALTAAFERTKKFAPRGSDWKQTRCSVQDEDV